MWGPALSLGLSFGLMESLKTNPMASLPETFKSPQFLDIQNLTSSRSCGQAEQE